MTTTDVEAEIMSDRTIQSSDGMLAIPAIVEMAASYKMDAAAFAFTFRAVAMPQPHTEAEFVSCCLVAREHGLNPLTKEIYFMRTKGAGIQAIVSVDGWMKKCNEHPKFDGMEFADTHTEAGELVATTCVIYRSDRRNPIRVTEYLDECRQNGGPVWKSAPRRMLRHRALTQCARYAFGFAGVMDRDEFDQWQRTRDITPPSSATAAAASLADIPEIPDAAPATPAAPPADDAIADPDGLIAKLKDELAGVTDEPTRLEIWDAHMDLVSRMSDAHQREAEAVYQGRQQRR